MAPELARCVRIEFDAVVLEPVCCVALELADRATELLSPFELEMEPELKVEALEAGMTLLGLASCVELERDKGALEIGWFELKLDLGPELKTVVLEPVTCIALELDDTALKRVGLVELEMRLELELELDTGTMALELDANLLGLGLVSCELELDNRALELVDSLELVLNLEMGRALELNGRVELSPSDDIVEKRLLAEELVWELEPELETFVLGGVIVLEFHEGLELWNGVVE